LDRRAARTLVWIALVPPLLLDGVYLLLIRLQGEGPPDVMVVPFVATYLFAMVLLLAASLMTRLPSIVRLAFRAAAAAGLIVFGILAAFSIGLPIIICGVVAAVAVGLSFDQTRWRLDSVAGAAGAVVALTILVGGFDMVERVIACPATGESGGSTVGFFTGSRSWHCTNGELHWS
jgi:hypothetical protein